MFITNRLRFILFWITLGIMVLLILAQLGYFGSYLKHEALVKSGLPPDSNTVTVSHPSAEKPSTTSKHKRNGKAGTTGEGHTKKDADHAQKDMP